MIYITHKIFFRNIKPSIINFTTLKAALGEKYPDQNYYRLRYCTNLGEI